MQEGFIEGVKKRWYGAKEKIRRGASAVDVWHTYSSSLRQYLKGWGSNQRGEYKRRKMEQMSKIEQMDIAAEQGDLTLEMWEERYKLEYLMEELFNEEEIYWQQ